MQYLDSELEAAIERRLDGARIPSAQHADYHKWFSSLKQAKSPLDMP